jgi:hypothetical protein
MSFLINLFANISENNFMKNILSVFTITLLITNSASATPQPAPAVNPPPGHGATTPASPAAGTEGAPAAYKIQGEAIHKMATMMGSCGVENARALRNDPGQLTYKIKEGLWEGMYLYHSGGSQEPIMEEPTAKDILAKRFTKPDGTAYASYNDLPEDLQKAVANLATVFVKNFKSLTTEDAKNKKVDTQYEESKDPREQYRKYLSVINGVLRDDSADGALIHGAETALANWLEKCSSNAKPAEFDAALGAAAKVAETEKKASEDFKGKVAESSLAKRAEGEKNLAPEKQFATKKLAAMEKLHADYQKVKNDPNATPAAISAAEAAYKKGLEDLKKGSSPDAVKDIDALLAKDSLGAGSSTAGGGAISAETAKQNELAGKLLRDRVEEGNRVSPSGEYLQGNPRDENPVLLKDPNLYTEADLIRLQEERDLLTKQQGEATANVKKIEGELAKIAADSSSTPESIEAKRKELEGARSLAGQVNGLLKRADSQELRYNLSQLDAVASDVTAYMKNKGIKGSSLSTAERVKIEADFAEKQLLQSRKDAAKIKKAESDAAEKLSLATPSPENETKASAARSAYLQAEAQLKRLKRPAQEWTL